MLKLIKNLKIHKIFSKIDSLVLNIFCNLEFLIVVYRKNKKVPTKSSFNLNV